MARHPVMEYRRPLQTWAGPQAKHPLSWAFAGISVYILGRKRKTRQRSWIAASRRGQRFAIHRTLHWRRRK